MITEQEKNIICDTAKKYNAARVLLFGSSMETAACNKDIDIAVEGICAKDFFKFYGDLLLALSKPVDVMDLSSTSKFNSLILQEGVLIYG